MAKKQDDKKGRTNLDLYKEHLFSDVTVMQQCGLMPEVQRRLLRLREVYAYWRRFPSLSSREIEQYIVGHYPDVRRSMAWNDVWMLQNLLGSLNRCSKEWHAYVFNQKIMELHDKAVKAQDYRSAEKALADYAKYNRLNVEDGLPDDWWKELMPAKLVMTENPEDAGMKPIANINEYMRKWNARFKKEAEDAVYQEVNEVTEDADDGGDKTIP